MENIEMSRRDVIVFRGIWYVMTLLSLFGLSVSLNLLWPPGGKSPASSRFLRDGAVSATTFYAVTVLRYLLFTDPPSTNGYKDFTTEKERIPQLVFAELALLVLLVSPLFYSDHDVSFVLYMSLFTISLFIGGTGLIQLSDKFRMEMKHAYITLLCVTVLRYLLFTDPPSTNGYKDFTTEKERIPQLVFAELALLVLLVSPLFYSDHDVSFVLYMSLFTISLFIGGTEVIDITFVNRSICSTYDPDYDRSYDRYVRVMPSGQSFNPMPMHIPYSLPADAQRHPSASNP
ncbi:hypothetical protein DY000_02003986 [Brassica cretica]|uniref:Dolichol kinase n=2 Tax=Brassica TaxID=3705 RepID=A0ABQ7CJE7_BRACR|nr:hypothetical protein DY000_02003986 [Brassica cretica]